MAIVRETLDPNAAAYTDDEIVGKINTASVAIDRADALDVDALDLIKTSPAAGEFKVKTIQRDATGKYAFDFDDTAV